MPKKVMFDSSCVYAIVSPDLEIDLAKQLPKSSRMCKYYTGQYLRMEFLRRWIVTGIEIYFQAHVTENVPGALQYFSHKFGRESKIALNWAARYIESEESDNPTEPLEKFGWMVVRLAQTYDKIFHTHVQPKTGCSRGITQLDFEKETRKDILRDFYKRFTQPSHICKLEYLINFQGGCPKLRKVMDVNLSQFTSKQKVGFEKLQKNLKGLMAKGELLTCKSCLTIGDLIIVLEQPPKTMLYHTDYAFSIICPLLNHSHQQVKSALSLGPAMSEVMAS